jgi:hypothetical protein
MVKSASVIFIALLFLSGCHHKAANPPSSSWVISSNVPGHTLTISSSARFAGAISSLIWNGKEFINTDDHGRELQSASSFDGLGECYNPTEAGGEADWAQDTSTSKLLYFYSYGNQIKSSAQMAFWTRVNQAYPQGCGTDTSIKVAQNTTNLSNHILTKQVTIGFDGIANAIEFIVSFHVPEHHTSATFESLTGYLTQDFSSFWTFNPATQTLDTLSVGPGEQPVPVILSTVDSQYAMGIYSPDLPQPPPWNNLGYGRKYVASHNTMKWNAVFRKYDTPAGDYSFRLYVVVGSLTDVTRGMTSVYHKFYP